MRTQYFYITGKSFHDERAFRVMGDIEYGLSTQLDTPLPFWENRRINDAALRIKFHDGAMHMNEPGKLKIWGFWNILGEERYGAGKERIRPWYYAMSLLCRYFPQGAQILASGVSGVGGVRSMFGRTEKGVTLAVVNTDSERTVELTLENPQPGLSDLALYVYAPGRLRLGGERLLPVERGVALAPGSRISLAPETMLVYTSME